MTTVRTARPPDEAGHGREKLREYSAARFGRLRTGRYSLLHALFDSGTEGTEARWRVRITTYVATVLATYVPLCIAVATTTSDLLNTDDRVSLPFALDANVWFMYFVSLPLMVLLIVSDRRLLAFALQKISRDRILVTSPGQCRLLCAAWETCFARVNVAAQLAGVLTGASLALANYAVYSDPAVGFWAFPGGEFGLTGGVFLYGIFVFYAVVPVFVFRSIAIVYFLRAIVRASTIEIVPFHPDRCGGLRPVGRIGLRNQYLLTVFGLNLLALVAVSVLFLRPTPGLYGLLVAAGVAYVVLGPIVFLGPLLPFRDGMLEARSGLMNIVADRMRVELDGIREKIRTGQVTKEDEELLARLRKIGDLVGSLPVWPFDAETARRFVVAYLFPLLGVVAYPAISAVVGVILGSGS